MARFSRIQEMNVLASVIRHVSAVATAEGVVVVFGECDRKACREARYSRNRPSAQQFAAHSVGGPGERQIIAIADDKIMCDIKNGEGTTQAWIEGVDRVKEARRVIDGFGPSVGRQ